MRDGEDHDADIVFAIVIDIAQAPIGLQRKRKAEGKGRCEVAGGDLTGNLRFKWDDKIFVTINETSLVLEDDQRIVDATGEEGVAVMQLSGNDNRSAFVVDDVRCASGQRTRSRRIVFILLADGERRERQKKW